MDRQIQAPLDPQEIRTLRAGDYVKITGTIYTARDAAHKRMKETLDRGEALPFSLENNVIYYMGPSPAREGRPIGSAGPTTASRMDKYAPELLDLGLKGMIGKGKRTVQVKRPSSATAPFIFCRCRRRRRPALRKSYPQRSSPMRIWGAEAIRKLEVKDFPVIVVIDSEGNNLYETAIEQYREI